MLMQAMHGCCGTLTHEPTEYGVYGRITTMQEFKWWYGFVPTVSSAFLLELMVEHVRKVCGLHMELHHVQCPPPLL